MASKFFVGNGTNWSSTGSWSLSSGGASGAAVPSASDDVFLDANSPGNLTIDVASACGSLNLTGFTHHLNHNAFTLTIGTSTAAPGNAALVFPTSGWTYFLGNVITSAISFTSTVASTTQTVDFGGQTTGNVTFNAATNSGYQLVNNGFTCGPTATVTLTQGKLDTNGMTCSWGLFNSNNSNTRNLTLGVSTITVTGTGTAWNVPTATSLTISAASSTITLTGATVTFSHANSAGSAATFGTLNLNGSGVTTYLGQSATGNSFANFARNGINDKTESLVFFAKITVTSTLTLTGNSTTNRLLVKTDTVGTSRTLTAAAISISNVDFMDITGAGLAANAAWTGSSLGNALGNSNITFDTPVTRYAVVAGNWSSTATWSTSSGGAGGASVPLPQDTVNLDANSAAGTYVTDMPRLGADVNFTGFTRSINFNTTSTIYGSLTLSSTLNNLNNSNLILAGRSSKTITCAGKTFPSINIIAPGGTYTLQDNFILSGNFTLSNGTLDAATNNVNVTSTTFFSISTPTRVLNMGTGTWTVTGTGGVWNLTTTGMTLSPSTSTIALTNTTSTAKTFAGGGATYNNLTIASSTGPTTFTGANTFNTITLTAPQTVTFPSSTTTTVSGFVATGSSGNPITINSSTPTIQATLSKSSGIVSCDWLALTDSAATGGATWYAGANSTGATGQDNSGWIFTGVPSGGFFDFM